MPDKVKVVRALGKVIVTSLFDYLRMVYQHKVILHTIVPGQYYMQFWRPWLNTLHENALSCIYLIDAYTPSHYQPYCPIVGPTKLQMCSQPPYNPALVHVAFFVTLLGSQLWNQCFDSSKQLLWRCQKMGSRIGQSAYSSMAATLNKTMLDSA